MLRYINSPKKYTDRKLDELTKELKYLRVTYFTLNIISGILGAAGAIITALVISKIIWSNYPSWFFFLTAGVSSFGTFTSSIINFFWIKDQIEKKKSQIIDIESEIYLFESKAIDRYKLKNREYILFLKVAMIAGNTKAREEYNEETKKI